MDPSWDWLYDHHRELAVVIAVATCAVVVAVVAGVRRRSFRRGAAWGIAPCVVVVLLLTAWLVADRRSNASDIERRVREVTSALPASATRTSTTKGDNFLTESYVVPGDVTAVGPAVWTAAKARLGTRAGIWTDPAQGQSPTYIAISFVGRNGCDGSVQVNINLAAATDATNAEVSGSCED